MGIRREDNRPVGRSLAVRDAHGVETAPGHDDAPVLALAVGVDELARLR
jgi:hypothetical protein